MIKRLLKDSVIYTLGTALTRGIGIIMVPIYTRLLSPADYGIIDLFTIIGSFVNVTIALEINQGFGRYYSEASGEQDKADYSSTAFWFVICANLLFFFFVFLFAPSINNFVIDKNSPLKVFNVAMASVFMNGIFIFLQNQLRWYLKSKQFAITGVIFTIIAYSTTIVLMTTLHLKAEGVFWGFICGYTIAGILSYFYSKNNYHFKFNFQKLKEMLSFSVPLVPASIGTVVLLYIDRFAIKSLMTLTDMGVFSLSYRFAAIVSLVLTGFQSAIAPLIYQNYKEKETPAEMERIFRYFLTVVLSFILLISLFAREALFIFTTPSYYKASVVIPAITLASLFLSMNVFTPGLSIAKKTRIIAFINITAAILNSALNFILIPIWGILGSALSTLFSAIITFSLYMVFSQKHYKIPYNTKKIVFIFAFVFLIVSISMLFDTLIYFDIYLNIVVKVTLWVLIVVFLVYSLIGFQKLNEIKLFLLHSLRSRKSK